MNALSRMLYFLYTIVSLLFAACAARATLHAERGNLAGTLWYGSISILLFIGTVIQYLRLLPLLR